MPVTINLSKSDSGVPWGFRLHGGKDFGAPLTVQRINPGSVAARCGLQVGDNISAIDSVPTSGLKHKEAQDLIVKAGNSIRLSICRESYKPRIPSYSSGPASYKAPSGPTISSKNTSLYQPTLQKITSGLAKSSEDNNHDADDFPPPPPILPPPVSPNQPLVSPGPGGARSHHPIHRFPEVTITEEHQGPSMNSDPGRYIPSETYKLVKDMEAGLEVPFNPRTGAGVKSSPIQSKLVDILEKKHATIESERTTDKRPASPQPPFSVQKTNSSYGIPTGSAYNRVTQPQKFLGTRNPSSSSSSAAPPLARSPSPQPHPQSQSKSSIIDQLDPSAVPVCNVCNSPVRGAYIMAVNKIWCQEHFVCGQPGCRRNLSDVGFVEEQGQVYCKEDYEKYYAPRCAKCNLGILGNTVKALKSAFHPECFTCVRCNQAIMGGSFHLHEGQVYCDRDFSELFSAKCLGCNFPIEVGDNWIEAVGTNWHGECFNCSVCQTNLQNTGFVHKNGRFLCRDHAR